MRSEAALLHQDLLPVTLLRLASDDRLVDSVRAGSERAFEALFDRHHRPVLAFCRHMLGSSADAEDAVQHTFLAAYRDLIYTEKPIVLRPWLYAIARHRCLSVLRGRRERPSGELPERGVDNLASHVDVREDVRTTFADLTRLPEDQRAALILAELGDVSHEQIARILGCHRDKVKALVFQARASLTADRTARETPCADIRAQLATAGGALRHTNLRRHVRDCPGCRAYRGELRARPRAAALLLPAIGLKRLVLGAVSIPGGAGAAMTAGALGGTVATALVVVGVAGSAPSEPSAAGDGAPRPSPFAVALRPTASRTPAEHRSAQREPTAVVLAHAFRPATGELHVSVDAGAGGQQRITRVDAHVTPAEGEGTAGDQAGSDRAVADPAPASAETNGRSDGAPSAQSGEPNRRGPAAERPAHGQPRGRGPDRTDDASHRGAMPAERSKPDSTPADPPRTHQPVPPGNAAEPLKPANAGEPPKPDKAAEPPKPPAAPEKSPTATAASGPQAQTWPGSAGPPASNPSGSKANGVPEGGGGRPDMA
jgi:RNA polymerase sigma factor (sigma-70 family)